MLTVVNQKEMVPPAAAEQPPAAAEGSASVTVAWPLSRSERPPVTTTGCWPPPKTPGCPHATSAPAT